MQETQVSCLAMAAQRTRSTHARGTCLNMMTCKGLTSPSAGLTAICTLEPPHSTPISLMMATDASRSLWYSLSVRVCTDPSSLYQYTLQLTPGSAAPRQQHQIQVLFKQDWEAKHCITPDKLLRNASQAKGILKHMSSPTAP